MAGHLEGEPSSIFSAIDPQGPLEAVLLFKLTGPLVAGWTRTEARQDILTVMAATLFGSVATLAEALGDGSPSSVVLDTEVRRMLVIKTGTRHALLLVAPKTLSESSLRQIAKRILRRGSLRSSNSREHAPGNLVVKP